MIGSCSIYGLGIHVNVPIAGLAGLPPAHRIDVDVALGAMPPAQHGDDCDQWQPYYASAEFGDNGKRNIAVWRSPASGWFRIEYVDGTVFVINDDATRIWATWPNSATVEDTATYLLGPVLGFVLRLRGVSCLHASAVVMDGRVAAIAGPSGSGKSTVAAAFSCLGLPVVSDDVLAVVEEGRHINAVPAYPRLRLWPESVESLFGSVDALPRITPGWDKRFLSLLNDQFRFQPDPLPLAAIYFLDERGDDLDAPRIQELGGQDGLMALVANAHGTHLLDKTMRAKEFQFFGQLADRIPMRRVTPSSNIEKLPELCTLISDNFACLSRPAYV
jgi:hypothetical protein